jgi:uncharacterized protein
MTTPQRNHARLAQRLFVLAGLSLALPACAGSPPLKSVELKGQRFEVEIADDMAEQERGLMFRRDMTPEHGMLFLYANAQPQAFWMKNCYIALDILFFDAQGRFINGHYNTPPCRREPCPTYPAERPARYILELNGGVAKKLGLAVGDPITLPQ